jgi:hypothetical protein
MLPLPPTNPLNMPHMNIDLGGCKCKQSKTQPKSVQSASAKRQSEKSEAKR